MIKPSAHSGHSKFNFVRFRSAGNLLCTCAVLDDLTSFSIPPKANSITATMSAPSFAPYVLKRPWLKNMLRPLSNWYVNAASYRQLGLR